MSPAISRAAAPTMLFMRSGTTRRRGWRTATRETPAAAKAARSVPRRRSPATRKGGIGRQSPPAGNTPSPGLTGLSAEARPFSTCTASSGATLSVPGGIAWPTSTLGGTVASSAGA